MQFKIAERYYPVKLTKRSQNFPKQNNFLTTVTLEQGVK